MKRKFEVLRDLLIQKLVIGETLNLGDDPVTLGEGENFVIGFKKTDNNTVEFCMSSTYEEGGENDNFTFEDWYTNEVYYEQLPMENFFMKINGGNSIYEKIFTDQYSITEDFNFNISLDFVFNGNVTVNAKTRTEAIEIVKSSFGLIMGGNIHSKNDKIVDWEFDMYPEKVLTHIN